MKIKIIVVDFEIPPRAKRWALRMGIPAVVLGLAGVAYASLPHTFASGEVLTAANLNADLQNLDGRIGTVRTVAATITSDGSSYNSVTNEVPAGSVSTVTGNGDFPVLTLSSPFGGVPVCVASADVDVPATIAVIAVTAGSVSIVGSSSVATSVSIVCVGPQ